MSIAPVDLTGFCQEPGYRGTVEPHVSQDDPAMMGSVRTERENVRPEETFSVTFPLQSHSESVALKTALRNAQQNARAVVVFSATGAAEDKTTYWLTSWAEETVGPLHSNIVATLSRAYGVALPDEE